MEASRFSVRQPEKSTDRFFVSQSKKPDKANEDEAAQQLWMLYSLLILATPKDAMKLRYDRI